MDSQDAKIEIRSGNFLPAWLRFLVPSVTDLIFIILLAAMTGGLLAPRLLGDASIGWHIRNGELMLRSHAVTRVDAFSATMNGQPWYAWEWLYDVVIAGIHQWLGLNGVVFLTAVIIATTFALTLRVKPAARRGLASERSSGGIVAGSVHDSPVCAPSRLELVIDRHLVPDIGRLCRIAAGRGRQLWWLPLLMLLWVNVHGGFVVGLRSAGSLSAEQWN